MQSQAFNPNNKYTLESIISDYSSEMKTQQSLAACSDNTLSYNVVANHYKLHIYSEVHCNISRLQAFAYFHYIVKDVHGICQNLLIHFLIYLKINDLMLLLRQSIFILLLCIKTRSCLKLIGRAIPSGLSLLRYEYSVLGTVFSKKRVKRSEKHFQSWPGELRTIQIYCQVKMCI